MLNRLFRPSVFSITLSSAFSRVCLLSALMMIALGITWLSKASGQNASNGQTQMTMQNVTTLEIGKPIEQELAGGQRHNFQLMLSAKQLLNVITEQRGIDVAVSLFGPTEKSCLRLIVRMGRREKKPLR